MQVRLLPEDDKMAAAALAGAKQQCETKDQNDGSRAQAFHLIWALQMFWFCSMTAETGGTSKLST